MSVVIATPDHWHSPITVEACAAGKDVYVEKPISNTVEAAQKMVEAARKYGRVVQVGASTYSTLTPLRGSDGRLGGRYGLLYERDGYKYISYTSFDLDWLGGGCTAAAAAPGDGHQRQMGRRTRVRLRAPGPRGPSPWGRGAGPPSRRRGRGGSCRRGRPWGLRGFGERLL